MVGRGRFGVATVLFLLMLLAACAGPNLPNALGGSGNDGQTRTSTVTFPLSLAQPVSGIKASYTITSNEVLMREHTGLHVGADNYMLALPPGTQVAGPHYALEFLIVGYTGPGSYHVTGAGSYVQLGLGAGHAWHAGPTTDCTFTVASDVTLPRPAHQAPSDPSTANEVKGTFTCRALQPQAASDPEASIQNGTFDTLYHN